MIPGDGPVSSIPEIEKNNPLVDAPYLGGL